MALPSTHTPKPQTPGQAPPSSPEYSHSLGPLFLTPPHHKCIHSQIQPQGHAPACPGSPPGPSPASSSFLFQPFLLGQQAHPVILQKQLGLDWMQSAIQRQRSNSSPGAGAAWMEWLQQRHLFLRVWRREVQGQGQGGVWRELSF